MCEERFLMDCPFGSTVEIDEQLYLVMREPFNDLSLTLKNKKTGELRKESPELIVISHFLSHIDYMHLQKAGKPVPTCHVPWSVYGNNE